MIIASIIILTIYGFLIIWLIIGFDKVKVFEGEGETTETKFSIIIPFRNEENNLTELLNSLSLLDYPKELFEILMVNDDSDDNSIQIIEHFRTRHPGLPITISKNLRKSASPKKDAIETAIRKAQFEYIITTDADCMVPKNWLLAFDAFVQTHKPKLIAAPVSYGVGNSFLEQFQLFDFLSLQAATIGGFGINKPFLCNGANLCYQKSAFIEVNGFQSNDQIASGDDIFLLEKMKDKFPEKVHYLKSQDSMIFTKPQPTLSALISQRVRWAAKTSSLKGGFSKIVGIVVLLMNFLLALAPVFVITGYYQLFIILFLIKLILDYTFLHRLAVFYNLDFNFLNLFGFSYNLFSKETYPLKFYLITTLFYPFFSTYIAFLSFYKSYNWKGRKFKK